MIIQTLKRPPQLKELCQVLKEEFPSTYTCKIFDAGSEQSIIVKKSTLTGVQIATRENEIVVDGTFPSVTTSFFSALISALGIWMMPWNSWWKFENEIATALKRRYA